MLSSYVQFTKQEEAEVCIREMKEVNIRDHIVNVDKFVAKSKRPKPNQCNLYIKNFPSHMAELDCEIFIKDVPRILI